jgi:non-heme chloroperoxidase
MPFMNSSDQTLLFYQDWGRGKPVLFVHGWCLGAEMWEYQMVPLLDEGLRCIAYDERGCGRSDRPGHSYDFDTLADDLAAVIEHLDLRDLMLVGHSMGGAQIIRYLARHGSDRVSRIALVAATAPFLLKTKDNPDGGVEEGALNEMLTALRRDRAQWAAAIANPWFGNGLPGVSVSTELMDWGVGLFMKGSPLAAIDMLRAGFVTDFRADTRAVEVPTLIIHGDSDVMVPFEVSSRRLAEEIPRNELEVYENASHGLFVSHKTQLNDDLLSFSKLRGTKGHD